MIGFLECYRIAYLSLTLVATGHIRPLPSCQTPKFRLVARMVSPFPVPAVPSDPPVGVELVAEEGLLAVAAHPHLEAIV